MQFKIEQIALCPKHQTSAARKLLEEMGLGKWFEDTVTARGVVFGSCGENVANLAFNYEADQNFTTVDAPEFPKPLELEVLEYVDGDNWMGQARPRVSHLGMHVSAEELTEWRAFFAARRIGVAQEVITQSHTNPVIKDTRRYNYVIFDTYSILGVDVKFIVRLPVPAVDELA